MSNNNLWIDLLKQKGLVHGNKINHTEDTWLQIIFAKKRVNIPDTTLNLTVEYNDKFMIFHYSADGQSWKREETFALQDILEIIFHTDANDWIENIKKSKEEYYRELMEKRNSS